MPSNPVLINLTRGNLVESLHRGALCIIRADGAVVISLGDIDMRVYPRSAIKVLQALPLVETGAADAAGFSDRDLALACASHSGEPFHTDTAFSILEGLSLTGANLACGPQWPMGVEAARELARTGGEPTPMHNNCSGKHVGMLALAKHLNADPAGYENPRHPVQQKIRTAIEEMVGEATDPQACAIDGCSVPTWAIPLRGMAHAFAKLSRPDTLPEKRKTAALRLMAACTSHPEYVEGTGRFGTGVMKKLGQAAFVKGGAEGVYAASFPEQGLGLAIKIDDGAKRGAEAVAAFILYALFTDRLMSVDDVFETTITNWRGDRVGEVQPSQELDEALTSLGQESAS